jgi:thiol-disulfide isomerase/thioredoxin
MKLAGLVQLAFVAVAAVAVYGFMRTGVDAERRRSCGSLCALRADYAGRNRRVPEVELDSLGGGRVRLADYRGRVVILNFWTKHCPPCLEEMPSLAELAAAVSNRDDVAVLSVCTDETPEEVNETVSSVLGGPSPFPVLLDPGAQVVTGEFGTELFPETWLIAPDGIIRARFDGPRDFTSPVVMDLIESLLLPTACPADFAGGVPVGAFADVCG